MKQFGYNKHQIVVSINCQKQIAIQLAKILALALSFAFRSSHVLALQSTKIQSAESTYNPPHDTMRAIVYGGSNHPLKNVTRKMPASGRRGRVLVKGAFEYAKTTRRESFRLTASYSACGWIEPRGRQRCDGRQASPFLGMDEETSEKFLEQQDCGI